MSFLDNLENSLKTLESRDEAMERNRGDQQRREAERESARAAAPYAEALRSGSFTKELLDHATRIGHGMRIKIHIAWLGTTLRLEARHRKLELRPTGEGVIAAFLENGAEIRSEKMDLTGNAEQLARSWLQPQ